VTFAYGPHAEPVLKDLDLTVPEGDHLAIVGPSGIGKSTLARLLCGLQRPDSGAVLLGGAPAADLPAERLAGLRVLIPQEAYVFAGTVWDNLTYLRAAATAAQVTHAVATIGAESLVARLGGYPAQVVPAQLSAGERQLLALVRAYLSAAPVVVLDEATCHLDPAAEGRAEAAFVLDGTRATVGDHASQLAVSPLYRELLGHWAAGSEAEPRVGYRTRNDVA
jgi:ATP-binding cassette subfamily C protein